jgi:riboflavin biosynthesis pyrimidine reductase
MLHDGAGVVTLLTPEGVPTAPALARLVDTRSYRRSDGLAGALKTLGDSGVVSLLCEAGPRLLTALYDGALIDELVLVHGGGMAGASAPDLYLGATGPTESLAKRLHVVDAGRCDADAVTVWRPDEEGTYPAGTDRS